ncbi:uncharacterized protein LOC123920716 isoform X2 [Trifolium pratense]|uniref:uncharacterized protein LOC123920716 isoform X2 n=1 Tax=Trifolium pratense TaxID=57577 RepID=UPI001E691F1E|nr:uncharacterized protein LOC123920716 isoform X2 [Trifolium pratense]
MQCNVGYEFISMLSPSLLFPFFRGLVQHSMGKSGKSLIVKKFDLCLNPREECPCEPFPKFKLKVVVIQENDPSNYINIQAVKSSELQFSDSLRFPTKRGFPVNLNAN